MHFISMNDFDRVIIEKIFDRAEFFSVSSSINKDKFLGKKLGIMFFQNSTRTRLSFESAMLNLGGSVLGFSDPAMTRSGDFFMEPLEDAVQVIAQLVNCIVLRHHQSFSAKMAASISPVPIINCGDGGNEHPTQTLIDLWTIKQYVGTIDGLKVGIMGILTTRTIRSLIIGLTHFKVKKILFLKPLSSPVPDDILIILRKLKIAYEFYEDIIELLEEADVLELYPINLPDFEKSTSTATRSNISTPDNFRLTKNKFLSINRDIPILHCGPRLDELSTDTDTLPQSMYFKQVKNSVYIRMALLDYLVK